MNLEIDAGNTRVKWRLCENGKVRDRGSVATTDLAKIKSGISNYPVRYVIVSSVLDPAHQERLSAVFTDVYGSSVITYLIKSEPVMAGVKFCYQDITRLGVDRCLAMVAAFNKVDGSVLVVDSGSAITADIVSSQGDHLGGYIMPGYRLLEASLMSGTRGVLLKDRDEPALSPGCSTESCVDNGLNVMLTGALSTILNEARKLGVMNTVLTGGDAPRMMPVFDGEQVAVEPDLVFDGLALMARAYSGKAG